MITNTITQLVTQAVSALAPDVDIEKIDIDVEVPPKGQGKANFGDYATSVAFKLAKELKRNPGDIAVDLAKRIVENIHDTPIKSVGFEAGYLHFTINPIGGYVNFNLSKEYILDQLKLITKNDTYGTGDAWDGKKIMVEYTDANIMKPPHIGHLMSNAIGESIARLFESQGAQVKRVDYHSDIGMNIAMAVWGMKALQDSMPNDDADLTTKNEWLGKCYVHGVNKAKEDPAIEQEIKELNKALYAHSDKDWDKLYYIGKEWSETHVQEFFKQLGTTFDIVYPESRVADAGVAFVKKGLEMGVLQESDGAIIFKGEDHGLHTRVFLNAQGLPTYEAKELGLNQTKYEEYPFDHSVIVTGMEIKEYFHVVLKAMSMINPDIAAKTKHLPHGHMKLTTGKMSSRSGNVITAEGLFEDTKARVTDVIADNDYDDATKQEVAHHVAIAALKYPILKTSIGSNIVHDPEKAVAFTGDSGPYVQYTYARMQSILTKGKSDKKKEIRFSTLSEDLELQLIKQLMTFPAVVRGASETYSPNDLAHYLFELANLANSYYEKVRILDDENDDRKHARLTLITQINKVLKRGLWILGIETLEQI